MYYYSRYITCATRYVVFSCAVMIIILLVVTTFIPLMIYKHHYRVIMHFYVSNKFQSVIIG